MSVEFTKQLERRAAVSTSNEEEFRVQRIESVLRECDADRGKLKLYNLHTKVSRLLKKYKERKTYEQERKLEWERVNQQKPNSDVNHPDDVQAIQEAEQTVGDYKLKLDEDYVPPEKDENGGDSLLMKQAEILEVQERIYQIKRDYNDRVFAMRRKKEEILQRIKGQEEKLKRIHRLLPEEMRKTIRGYKDFDEDLEFPEKFIGEERKREDIKHYEEVDKEDFYDQFLFYDGDEDLTELEKELRAKRIEQKSFQQEVLLKSVAEEIMNFDCELEKLAKDKLYVDMDALFLETFLLTLQKEYSVIGDFHEEEVKLAARADEKRIENSQFLSKILTQETALEASKKAMELYKNERKALQQTFESNCLDNKFTDFLKWIFEKNEDDVESHGESRKNSLEGSSISSGSVSSGQEDYSTVSITSSNYDETFCPRGCDPDLYRLVFDLRQSRFEVNKKLAEEEQVHARVKGDLEFLTKEIKDIQVEQRRREEEYVHLRVS